jgi:hypothetical protein
MAFFGQIYLKIDYKNGPNIYENKIFALPKCQMPHFSYFRGIREGKEEGPCLPFENVPAGVLLCFWPSIQPEGRKKKWRRRKEEGGLMAKMRGHPKCPPFPLLTVVIPLGTAGRGGGKLKEGKGGWALPKNKQKIGEAEGTNFLLKILPISFPGCQRARERGGGQLAPARCHGIHSKTQRPNNPFKHRDKWNGHGIKTEGSGEGRMQGPRAFSLPSGISSELA